MSICTAEQIAEKKRIALEKLKARQQNGNITSPSNTSKTVGKNTVSPENFYSKNNVENVGTSNKFSANNFKNSKDSFLKAFENQSSSPVKFTPVDNSKKIAPVFLNVVKCECYMISDSRFAVKTSAYSEIAIKVFKEIPSKAYDTQTRLWTFNLTDYDMLQERIAAHNPNIVIGTIPKKIRDVFSKPKIDLDYSCLASIEHKISDSLLPFQKEGVCFGISRNGRIMIADEMGLGKTYQALAIADFYKDDWPVLICTTASTRNSWMKHVRELLPSVACHHVVSLTSGYNCIDKPKIVVTSYSMLESNIEKLLDLKFGVIILDESHSLKSCDAKRTITTDRLSQKARRVILLSGTPALSRPVELYSQLRILDKNFLSYRDYTKRYCEGKQTNFGWDATGQSNLPELNAILSRKFMIRRTKSDVLPDLSHKSRETVILDPLLIWTNDDLKKNANEFKLNLSQSTGSKTKEILITFYSKTAELKAQAVCDYLKKLVKEKIKFLIFAHHKVMMNAIASCLNKLKINYVKIDGTTRNDLRTEYIDTFQTKESCQVAVLSLHACNAGITLTAAQLVVFAELDWNPSTLVQAESRAHRIGQKENVICRYLIAENTADDVIWKMLKDKQNVLHTAGLFCEDLQNADFIKTKIKQSPGRNMKDYFDGAKRKSTVTEEVESSKKVKVDVTPNNEFNDLLNDDDDDDFVNLNF